MSVNNCSGNRLAIIKESYAYEMPHIYEIPFLMCLMMCMDAYEMLICFYSHVDGCMMIYAHVFGIFDTFI